MKRGKIQGNLRPSIWIDAELVFVSEVDWFKFYEPNKKQYYKAALFSKLMSNTSFLLHPEFKTFEKKTSEAGYMLEIFTNEKNINLTKQELIPYSIFVYEDVKLKYINVSDIRVRYTISNKPLKCDSAIKVDNLFDVYNKMEGF